MYAAGASTSGAGPERVAADEGETINRNRNTEQIKAFIFTDESAQRRDTPRSPTPNKDVEAFQSQYMETAKKNLESESDQEYMDTSVITPQPTPSETEKFTTPKKTISLEKIMRIQSPQTIIKNTFQPLSKLTENEQTTATQIREKTLATRKESPPQTKSQACPPIVLQGTPDTHQSFTKNISQHIKKGFQVKYTRYSTLLYIKDKQEYNEYKNNLKTTKTEFHTYTPREEKTHAFVLRGLQGDIEIDDIKYELIDEHKIPIKNIFKMKTKAAPLYLIITDDKTTLKHLTQNVRVINCIRITWERRINQRIITQCRRCQAWGHATSNCYKTPKCMKCASSHWTRDCTKSPEEPPKCVNCGQGHTASNLECPVYIKKTESMIIQPPDEGNTQTRYVTAPTPTVNIWAQRAAATTRATGAVIANGATVQKTTPQEASQTIQRPIRTRPVPDSRQPATNVKTTEMANDPDGFAGYVAASERLSSLIDLREAARALHALCDVIESANGNKFQIIVAMQNFAENILPQFNFQRST